MLRFREIVISNFAVFQDLRIRPSTDPDRPLTVVRAENGSGKTTLLRALLWGMYGERGLPGERNRYSVHPSWWTPDSQGIETRVEIEFETDGSSRDDPSEGGRTRIFRLSRTVRTVMRAAEAPEQPDFAREPERTRLMKRGFAGRWHNEQSGVEEVVEQLLPWGLREFLVTDADRAADFVGGAESSAISREEVEQLTTGAVRSLLGIEVFERASGRLEGLANGYRRAATKAAGDLEIQAEQSRHDDLSSRRDTLACEISEINDALRDLKHRRAECREELERELRNRGGFDSLLETQEQAREMERKASGQREEALRAMTLSFESSHLLAPLAIAALRNMEGELRPRYNEGQIPQRHVAYVRGLLRRGFCVCGENLSASAQHRERVGEQLRQAENEQGRADFLGHLYESSRDLLDVAEQSNWVAEQRQRKQRTADAQGRLDDAKRELRNIKSRVGQIDQDKVRALRGEQESLDEQIGINQRLMGGREQAVREIASEREAAGKRLAYLQRSHSVARRNLRRNMVAELAADVLRRACERVRQRQVEELSLQMDQLFGQIAANVEDVDFERDDPDKKSVRMIARVGVRTIAGRADRFEIFALNPRGRTMPATEINGASRRVLALAFVLALCAVSRTHAPLVADSLLNAMSGTVRRNTLAVTVRHSDQPILLLTGSDLESEAEADIVRGKAGACYTLTGQWDAGEEGGQGGDVLRRTSEERVALLCECGPREYCRVCERAGWANKQGWTEREEPQTRGITH